MEQQPKIVLKVNRGFIIVKFGSFDKRKSREPYKVQVTQFMDYKPNSNFYKERWNPTKIQNKIKKETK